MNFLGEVQAVNKNESLSHLAALENFFDEFEFSLWLASHYELLDVLQLELLSLDGDLLGLLDQL